LPRSGRAEASGKLAASVPIGRHLLMGRLPFSVFHHLPALFKRPLPASGVATRRMRSSMDLHLKSAAEIARLIRGAT
jgi:hypothetical protein